MASSFLKNLLCVLVAGLTVACTNLAAVKDFASTSSKLAGYTDVTGRYVTGPERIGPQIPVGTDFESDRAAVAKQQTELASQKESLFKLHAVTSGYMAALASLAGDDTFNISPQIDKVTGALVAAPKLGIDVQTVQAYGSIASKVASWILAAEQAKQVKSMVLEFGPSMDVMLAAMQTATTAMREEFLNERAQLVTYEQTRIAPFMTSVGLERPAPSGTPDPLRYEDDRQQMLRRNQSTVAWASRSYAQTAADQDKAVASATAAIEGIKIVRKGHADLQKNIDDLSGEQVVKLLKKAKSDLDAIRGDLQKL